MFVAKAKTIWLSYNAKWTFEIGRIVCALQESYGKTLTVKPCVQTYTFGQHNHHDLGNNHRPLIRFQRAGAPLYPDAIRVPSWRQENGDKRADPRGACRATCSTSPVSPATASNAGHGTRPN